MASSSSTHVPVENSTQSSPICIIVLGMAGSGKTSFVQKLTQISFKEYKPYVINLDPACHETPYHCNIDIRDTIDYKAVMKQYKLGPNGGIVTSLNLFATKFDKVVELVQRAGQNGHKFCVIDTPGQIEVFNWSASGSIITEALATMFPTIVVYVMDVVRSISPNTFMSNMLYACSILYRYRLPFMVALNKIDVQDHDFIIEWMTDFEAFLEALEKEQTYSTNLSRIMSLTLDEFYSNLKTCGISSKTGVGFDRFFTLLKEGAEEYERDYKVEYNKLREKKRLEEAKKTDEKLEAIAKSSGAGSEVNLTGYQEEVDEEEEIQGVEEPTFNSDYVEEQNFLQFIQPNANK